MAQSKNSKKSEGMCEKIHNAVSPFRPRTRRISHQPQSLISITSNKNPVEISSPQTKPVHVLHQTSMSETIPVEFRHAAAHFSAQNGKKECHDEGEIVIVRGQKFAKSASKKEEFVWPAKAEQMAPLHHVHFAKAKSMKDEDHHEGKFSDYISKFKNRMIKTASNVGGGDDGGGGGGGGGGRGNSIRRDSFNDKVASYIDHAKMKIRTTTNVGVDQKSKY